MGPFEKGMKIFRIVVAIGGAVCAASEVLLLAAFGWSIINFMGVILSLVLLFLGVSRKVARSILAQITERNAPPMGERLYTYHEDHIESLRSETTIHIPYESVRRVLVYHDSFYLILGTEEVPSMVHPKSRFTVGTAYHFEAFI